MSIYCKKCSINNSSPDAFFDEDGVCSICKGEYLNKSAEVFALAYKRAIEFQNFLKHKNNDNYHCILMLSGGKDSIYMMHQLKEEFNARQLAYTFSQPYESGSAENNIKNSIQKLGIEHISYTPNIHVYNKIMKSAFIEKQYSKEVRIIKMPCYVCNSLMQISAVILAQKLGIPYVVYCADPMQVTHFCSDVNEAIDVIVSNCGKELLYEFFTKQSIEKIQSTDNNLLPKIVFPYAGIKYNAQKIIDHLRELGVYNTTPEETHCNFWSLLHYYSFRRYDSFFYSTELAYNVRNGMISRDDAIRFLELYKHIILNIAPKSQLSAEEKEYILKVLTLKYPKGGSALDFEYNNILSMHKIAKDLNVDFKDI